MGYGSWWDGFYQRRAEAEAAATAETAEVKPEPETLPPSETIAEVKTDDTSETSTPPKRLKKPPRAA